jgi:phosphate:Na+ symporter
VRWATMPLAGLPKTQMAMAHTMFNVIMAIVFIPFILPMQWLKFSEKYNFANLIYWIIPKKQIVFSLTQWRLDETLLDTPAFAIAESRKRISELIDDVYRMLQAIIIPFVSDPKFIEKQGEKENWPQEEVNELIKAIPKYDEQNSGWTLIEGIKKREEAVDKKKKELENYRRKLILGGLKEKETKEIDSIIFIANHLENIADVVHDKVLTLLDTKRSLDYDLTDEGKQDLMIYHNKVCNPLKQLVKIFSDLNPRVRENIHSQMKENRELYKDLRSLHLERFRKRVESQVTDEVHEKFLEYMKIINNYIDEITKDCEILLMDNKK